MKRKLQQDDFDLLCQTAKTAQDLLTLTSIYENQLVIAKFDYYYYKESYNKYIGFGLASYRTCQLIVDFWAKNKECKLVDLGARTGVFSCIFNFLGIPKENLIALDLFQCEKTFWPITIVSKIYEVDINDILFVAWGSQDSGPNETIKSYVQRGGSKIIILGETIGGCTFPSDFFVNNSFFDVHSTQCPEDESLSINIRKSILPPLYILKLDISFILESLYDEDLTNEKAQRYCNGNKNDIRHLLLIPNIYRDAKKFELKPAYKEDDKWILNGTIVYGPTKYSLAEMSDLIHKSIAGSEPCFIIELISFDLKVIH